MARDKGWSFCSGTPNRIPANLEGRTFLHAMLMREKKKSLLTTVAAVTRNTSDGSRTRMWKDGQKKHFENQDGLTGDLKTSTRNQMV